MSRTRLLRTVDNGLFSRTILVNLTRNKNLFLKYIRGNCCEQIIFSLIVYLTSKYKPLLVNFHSLPIVDFHNNSHNSLFYPNRSSTYPKPQPFFLNPFLLNDSLFTTLFSLLIVALPIPSNDSCFPPHLCSFYPNLQPSLLSPSVFFISQAMNLSCLTIVALFIPSQNPLFSPHLCSLYT